MTRKKWILVANCFFSLVTFTTIALTQDETPVRRRTNPNQPPQFSTNPPMPTPLYRDPVTYGADLSDGVEIAYRRKVVARTVYESVAIPVSAEEVKQLQAMQSAKEKLKKAQNETARKEATDVIQKSLIKQFEQDLAQREKDLAAAEERLKTLRQQLDKRKLAKDEIVTLRLKTIVNNAEGLGFPGDEDPRSVGDDDAPVYGPYDPATFRRGQNNEVFEPVLDDEVDAPRPRRTPLQQPDGPPGVKPRAF